MGSIAPVRSHSREVRFLLRVHHGRFLLKYMVCAPSRVNTPILKGTALKGLPI